MYLSMCNTLLGSYYLVSSKMLKNYLSILKILSSLTQLDITSPTNVDKKSDVYTVYELTACTSQLAKLFLHVDFARQISFKNIKM